MLIATLFLQGWQLKTSPDIVECSLGGISTPIHHHCYERKRLEELGLVVISATKLYTKAWTYLPLLESSVLYSPLCSQGRCDPPNSKLLEGVRYFLCCPVYMDLQEIIPDLGPHVGSKEEPRKKRRMGKLNQFSASPSGVWEYWWGLCKGAPFVTTGSAFSLWDHFKRKHQPGIQKIT